MEQAAPGAGNTEVNRDQRKFAPRLETVPLPEGSSYLGFIFARGDSHNTVDSVSGKLPQAALRNVVPAFRVV